MRIISCNRWAIAALLALGSSAVPAMARAAVSVIPMDHLVSDVAYDAGRHLVYMSDQDQILRYDTDRDVFLAPFTVAGGPLAGMDLSPDGHSLAVADTDSIAVKVHIIDLDSGSDTVMSDATDFYEGGAYQVAYTREGNLLVSSSFLGSGWVPLRKLDVSSGTFTKLASVRQDSVLSTSGNGLVVGFAESNDSGGPWGHYDAKTGNMTHFSWWGTDTFNWGMTTNADGTKFIINGGSIYNGDNVGQFTVRHNNVWAVSSATDPVAPVGYFAFQGESQVKAYNLDTYLATDTFDFGEAFSFIGAPQLRISRDGSTLLARFDDGVRYLQVHPPLQADDLAVRVSGRRTQIALAGRIGNGGALTYGLQTPPAHGKVFIENDTATYVPAPGYTGPDSFTYATHYAMAVASATVTLEVTADTSAYAPSVSFDTLPVLQATTPVPGSTRVPGDFNGDGVSDLLWFNPSQSQLGYWTMAPTSTGTATVRRTGARTFAISAGYLVGAVGDLNGDGYADLMFTSPAHDLWLWTNSRTGGWRSTRSYDYPATWQLVGAGDVNGDGKDDLLWLDPSDCKFGYWLMDGAVRRGVRVMDVACGYYPVGVGYYSPTNRLSILWSSAANDLYIWDARGTGFRSYNLTAALKVGDYPTGLDSMWAVGGGYAGKGIGLEWNAQDQRFAVGASLTRTFDAQGNQTRYQTTLKWSGGLWRDDPEAAAYLIQGGTTPSTALYALDIRGATIRTGGLPTTDAATSGNVPRTMPTEWSYPLGWYPVGAPGNRAIPLPWR